MVKRIDKEQDNKKSDSVSEQKKPVMQNQSNAGGNNIISLRFTNQNLMEALIYSEILGEPKCKRRGRWR